MPLELFNTLSTKVEEFHPLEDNLVRMYACGPTVYDYGHIGNFRTFIVVDTLRRFLKQSGYQLKHVMNITDVDDKIIRNAARDGVTVQEYTRKYRQAFLKDADALNIEHPETVGECNRSHPGDGALHRRPGGQGLCVSHRRWIVLLPYCQVSRVRKFRRKILPA